MKYLISLLLFLSAETCSFTIDPTEEIKNCLINVHGFHHSGTGYLRHVIIEALGGSLIVSSHEKTSSHENEADRLQSVFPTFDQRTYNTDLCAPNVTFPTMAKLYYCPEALDFVINNASEKNIYTAISDSKKTLFREWSRYWDLSKTFVIQKTPTFDVLLLESLKIVPTFQAIIMRHPLLARGQGLRAFELPLIWLDTWTHTLEQILEGKIESFAVVNYEMLLLEKDDLSQELSTIIKNSCPYQEDERRYFRRLNFREKEFTPDFTFDNLSYLEKHFWKSCSIRGDCVKAMNEMKPIMYEFGYIWNMEKYFEPKKVESGGSKILFSAQKLPSSQLVKNMRKLVDKYF